MWKRALCCAALITSSALIAPAALADDPTPADRPDSGEKDLCNDLNNLPNPMAACAQRPDICFWDTSDQRCEWIGNLGPCANLPFGVCQQTTGCFWDSSDNRCEPIGTP